MPPRLGILLAVVFWGLSFVATKAAVAEISPIALIFARTALGAAFLVALLARRPEPVIPPRESWAGLAGMGFVGVAAHQLIQAIALTTTSAANAGWLIGLTPAWSALLSAIRFREDFPPRKLFGLSLGFAGAAVVITRGRLDAGALALPSSRGDLLILASTLNWAFYSTLGHPILRRLGPTRSTAGALVFGALMLLPFAAVSGAWRDYGRLTPHGWGALLFLGIACSGLGYLFWYGALEKIEVSRVAAYLYLEPLVTSAAAATYLGEPIGIATLAGGGLLLLGVAQVQRA